MIMSLINSTILSISCVFLLLCLERVPSFGGNSLLKLNKT